MPRKFIVKVFRRRVLYPGCVITSAYDRWVRLKHSVDFEHGFLARCGGDLCVSRVHVHAKKKSKQS